MPDQRTVDIKNKLGTLYKSIESKRDEISKRNIRLGNTSYLRQLKRFGMKWKIGKIEKEIRRDIEEIQKLQRQLRE